jgi:hypothetical protein
MQWSDLPLNPSIGTLRRFAVLWMVFFAVLAWRLGLQRNHPLVGLLFLILAGTVGPLGLVQPRTVRFIFVGWLVAVFPLGWALSQLLLAVVFYGVFTPLGLAFRQARRDALHKNRGAEQLIHWSPRSAPAPTVRYFQQF